MVLSFEPEAERHHAIGLYARGPMSEISRKAASFTESVIREMTRLAMAHDAVNLAQGFPDFACPPELKEAAKAAIDADINQYAITWGARDFREAIAAKTTRFYPDWPVDPETEITVTCGATEGMIAAMMAVLDPGDEVIVFEPYYENYGPDAILSGAVPRYVTLHEPDWHIDPDELRAAFTPRTRGVVLNSPHNPTGKVFSRDELELIARLCDKYDVVAFTDDIYEHIVYAGEHIPLATLPGMRERTVADQLAVEDLLGDRLAGRLGHRAAAPDERHPQGPRLPDRRRRRAAPGRRRRRPVAARRLLRPRWPMGYRERRDVLVEALEAAGFRTWRPGRRLLRDDRHHLPDRCRRRHLRARARRIAGRGRRPRLVVLLAAGARAHEGPIRVPEAARDAARGRRSAQADLASKSATACLLDALG